MKIQYIKCPRCELNYIVKKDKFCEVCKQEMKAGSLVLDELEELEEGVEICPICHVNYLVDGETICQSCQEEKMAYDKDEDVDWKSEVEKSSQGDEEEDLDLLPIEDNDDINEELQTVFSKDLDEDFMDEMEEDDEDYSASDSDDDFADSFSNDYDEEDEEDEEDEDYEDEEDDEDY